MARELLNPKSVGLVTPTQQLMQAALEVRATRAKLLAENVANVDTPGYLARDVRFQSAINRVLQQGIEQGASVETTLALQNLRYDRNDVNLNQQLAKVYNNSLSYVATLKLYGDSIRRLDQAMPKG